MKKVPAMSLKAVPPLKTTKLGPLEGKWEGGWKWWEEAASSRASWGKEVEVMLSLLKLEFDEDLIRNGLSVLTPISGSLSMI